MTNGEMMEFPETFDEFSKEYGFYDKEEVYTNGSYLIPVFRVRQWLEQQSGRLGAKMLKYGFHSPDMTVTEFVEDLQPIKQKTAYWISNPNGTISCSKCHTWFNKDGRYFYMRHCPYCNTQMELYEEAEE